ncbi:MAG: hypothetical protein V9F82_00070 [Dermatophilaceae bacterium]
MTQSRATRVVNRAKKFVALARETGPKLVATAKQLAADAPAIVTSLRHDAEVVRDIVASSGSSLSPMFVDLLAKAMVPPSEPEVAIDASVKVRAAKKTDETGGYKRTADAAAAAAELAEDGSSPTRSPATGRRPRFV